MGVTWKVTEPGSLDRKKIVVSIEWVEVEGTFCEWMITDRGCVVRWTRSPRW